MTAHGCVPRREEEPVKRWITTLLATTALVVAGLVAGAPAQAGDSSNTMTVVKSGAANPAALASCEERQRFQWNPTFYINPGDCYTTPASTLVMEHNGQLALYYAGYSCTTPTYGYFGAYAVFQDDGNLVVYYNGEAVWDSGTHGNYNARLILRGGDGALLIRNELGDEIWRAC
jgi:hypothetical protein